MPTDLVKLLRRLQHLVPGRHLAVITVDEKGEVADWTVIGTGKVER